MSKNETVTVAAVQYRFSPLENWEDFAKLAASHVKKAALQNAHFIVFPEYFGIHLCTLVEGGSLEGLQKFIPDFLQLFSDLSKRNRMVIIAGTIPVKDSSGLFWNRSYIFNIDSEPFIQDKINLIPSELDSKILRQGKEAKVFDTAYSRIGVAICYDSQFPPVIQKQVKAGASIIFVPSCTETIAGYHRVALSCRARAIENQCFVIQSPTIGPCPGNDWISNSEGRAGIYSPCDGKFPANGVLGSGPLNRSALVVGILQHQELENVRQKGTVANFRDYTFKN